MPEGARVDSLETLRAFKVALFKFQEAAQVALGDAEADATRTLMWVENEQQAYWQGQIRKAEQHVVRCKEAVRMKKVFKDSAGREQSAVDEEKVLKIAMQKLAEAQAKLVLVKRWTRQLQKEIELYKGGVQRFTTTVFSEIPSAAAHLESLSAKLDAYLAVQPAFAGSGAMDGSGGVSMTRGGDASGGAVAAIAAWIPVVPDPERRGIAELRVNVQPPAYDLAVLVNIEQPPDSLRLEREDAAWKVAPLQDAQLFDQARSVCAGELLAVRPDLGEMLSLPVGFSVIMDRAGIVEVLDPRRQSMWRRRDQASSDQSGQ
jgi:hypothetical protein